MRWRLSIAVACLTGCDGSDDTKTDPCTGTDDRVEIVARDLEVNEMVADDTDLWITTKNGIVRVLKSGHDKPATLPRPGRHIAVDADTVYWDEPSVQGLFAMNKSTIAIRRLVATSTLSAIIAEGDIPTSIALGLPARAHPSQFVYWVDGGGEVFRSTVVGADTPTSLAVNENISAVRVDASRLYFTAKSGVHSKALGGGEEQTVPLSSLAFSFVLDQSRGFIVNDSGLSGFDKPNGAATPIAPASVKSAATDGAAVYWIASSQCEIRASDEATGATRTIAAHQSKASAILVDETHVYWSVPSDRTIRRAPK